MARIKTPLLMADGEKVRTMEELREHFDIASVLGYYDSGKLREWLENYYYDKEADGVGALDASSADFKEKLCGILGVDCPMEEAGNIELADVSGKNRKLGKLKKYTGDDEILRVVDCVAFTQEELQGLLDKGTKKIYLCQEEEKFVIPAVEGVTYIGVNNPSASAPERFMEKRIIFRNVDIGIEGIIVSAEKYASEQNYVEAAKLWRIAAEQGDAKSQCELGSCYHEGRGMEKNYEEAYKWYWKAAEQGDVPAQRSLGVCYKHGNGVEKDEIEACKWYLKAAEQGDAPAQYNLGNCYYGNGVAQDYDEAYKWYRKAAEQGYAKAQNRLGTCYKKGKGVKQNYEEAVKWYWEAAEQGNVDAQFALGSCYYLGKGVERNFRKAIEWYKKAAEQGNADAQEKVGLCYECGNGVAKNMNEANKWYQKAAEQRKTKR